MSFQLNDLDPLIDLVRALAKGEWMPHDLESVWGGGAGIQPLTS